MIKSQNVKIAAIPSWWRFFSPHMITRSSAESMATN